MDMQLRKPRAGCNSALRKIGECHKCDQIVKELKDTPLDLILKNLRLSGCNPKISKEKMEILKVYDDQLTKKEELLNDIEITEKRLGIR
jgi:hypothetical protein